MPQLTDYFSKCAFFSASTLSRTLARVAEEHFGVFDLSPPQGYVLLAIKKAPGINTSDLAAVLVLDQSTVTKTIDRMVSKALVQREPFGRSVRLFLTGKGEVRAVEAKSAWMKTRNEYTRFIGDAEAKLLAAAMAEARSKLMVTGAADEDLPG